MAERNPKFKKPKRENGRGSIVFEKDRNKWRAYFPTPRGDRICKRFDTRKEAEIWLAQQVADISRGVFTEPSKKTLGEEIFWYLSEVVKPQNREITLRNYKQDANHITDDLAKVRIQSITAIQLKGFLNSLEISNSGKVRVYNFLKRLFRKLYQYQIIGKNVMDYVDRPTYQKEEIQTFTVEEIKRILDFLENDKVYQRYYPLILFASCSGCRLSEVIGLKIDNIVENGVLIKNTVTFAKSSGNDSIPKTNAGRRYIPLPKDVIDQLKVAYNQKSEIPCKYVFHTSTGNHLGQRNVERTWKKIQELVGLQHHTFHYLRHTHATQLLANGEPLLEVSKRLGHSSPSVTLNYYGHAIKNRDDKSIKLVSSIYL